MAKLKQDFEMYSGESKNIKITLTDEKSDTPLDVSNATITWVMKRSAKFPTNLIEKSTVNSEIEIVDAVNGVVKVKLISADTESLEGLYYHSAKIVDVLENTSVLLTGMVKVVKG